ncbi:MAG: V-type ATPase subunit [Gemmatimonadales bacterium]|jgi:hypothetical protein|nr:V-type ATPase subunit [Gemmatimonadales bacterium]
MTRRAPALATRSRGIASRLLSRATLEAARHAADLSGLQQLLVAAGMPLESGGPPRPDALELAIRRWAARHLARLMHWLPECPELGAILAVDEDRRSIRAIVRGASAGASAEQRLAGLIPTPHLGERELRELARQTEAAGVAALLVRWRHPLGPTLLSAVRSAEPDLGAVEAALRRASFATMHAAAFRVGGLTAEAVARYIDLENARLATTCAAHARGDHAIEWCLPGGTIPCAEVVRSARAPSAEEAIARLVTLLPAAARGALRDAATTPERMDSRLLAIRLTLLRAALHRDPVDAVAVLHFALRVRVQVILLQQAVWRLVLGGVALVPDPMLDVA